ncbi:MAG: Inner rane protein YhaH [Rhizobium sp.]|nr:Inner rane protein YhaH [Rhizobium sp.]
MDFATAVKSVLMQKYANFSGRAMRSEYWWYTLFAIIVSVVLYIVDMMLGTQLLQPIFGLATLLPGIGVSVRRLHDLDKSGWWLLIAFIPLIGALVLLYWFCQPGTPGDNQFGPPTA